MTMLTGRPGNFVRIPESQYKADIAAAEERGRAGASKAPEPAPNASAVSSKSTSSEPTQEQKEAMAEINRLRNAAEARTADDPEALAAKLTAYMAEQKKAGRNIGYAQATAELEAMK